MFLTYFFHIIFLGESPRSKITDKSYDFLINFYVESKDFYKTVVFISIVKSNV